MQRKARGHKDGVQAKDLGQTEVGSSSLPQVWNGIETQEVSMVKESQGEARRGAGERSQELV